MKYIIKGVASFLLLSIFSGCSKKESAPEVKECERLNKGTLTITNQTGQNCTVYIDGNRNHGISFLEINEKSSIELSAGEVHVIKVTPSVIDYPTYIWERNVRLGACLETSYEVRSSPLPYYNSPLSCTSAGGSAVSLCNDVTN